MLYALCSMLYKVAKDRLEECAWSPTDKRVAAYLSLVCRRHPPTDVGTGRPRVDGLLCRGKLWLEERTPEQLKGEDG